MSKNEETYEETLQKEFEMSQSKDDGVVKDLGRVRDVTGSGTQREYIDNDDMDRINDLVGFRNIPLTDLPSQGRYYPDNTKITIRAARVDEIHEFSSINEEDASDVIDKMTYIVSKCVKIYYGNVLGHYKDLINADRIVLILKIRELTFKEGLKGIKIPVPSDACSTSGCKPQDFIEFTSGMLTFYKPAPELEKYYDPENKCYNIQTKSYGTITLYIPTIGVTQAISSWINYKYEHKEKFTETLANMMPFVRQRVFLCLRVVGRGGFLCCLVHANRQNDIPCYYYGECRELEKGYQRDAGYDEYVFHFVSFPSPVFEFQCEHRYFGNQYVAGQQYHCHYDEHVVWRSLQQVSCSHDERSPEQGIGRCRQSDERCGLSGVEVELRESER